MKLNNKGVLQGPALVWAILMLTAASTAQIPAVKKDYQIKKMTQICVENGGEQSSCKATASNVSRAYRIWSLKDSQSNPRTDHKDLTNISKIRHL